MKPVRFEYLAPRSVSEAVDLLTSRRNGEPKVLAGGQSLVPTMNMRLARPTCLIDLNGIDDLRGISQQDGEWRIGAMTRHSTVEDSEALRAAVPLLHAVVTHIGYRQIRNRGTVGGSVCHADPAAEWPMLVRLLRADLDVVGTHGARTIPADGFFQGNFTSVLGDDEILTAVRFRIPAADWRWGFSEFSKRRGDFAIAAVGGILPLSAGAITNASLVAAGVGPTPVRLASAEAAIEGAPLHDEGLGQVAAEASVSDVDPTGDIHGSAAFKRHLVGVQVARVIAEARRQRSVGSGDGTA